jgi:hypothetical protein
MNFFLSVILLVDSVLTAVVLFKTIRSLSAKFELWSGIYTGVDNF